MRIYSLEILRNFAKSSSRIFFLFFFQSSLVVGSMLFKQGESLITYPEDSIVIATTTKQFITLSVCIWQHGRSELTAFMSLF